MIDHIISRYRIIEKIAAGGMGEVYLAEDVTLGRKVAIKLIGVKYASDEQAHRRFIREAKLAATLDHPNICSIYEIGEEDGRSFIAMQYIEGETLHSRLQRKPLGVKDSLEVALQIASALSVAHSRDIIHRDIKPQNIILTPHGQVKVLDFGLAKMVSEGREQDAEESTQSMLTESGAIMGTAAYMSPEQAKGDPVDSRSDLFSLGSLLYECLTGRRAFPGLNYIEICYQVIHVEVPPPSQLEVRTPPELDRVVLRLLAKRVEDRYQCAAELLSVLNRVKAKLQAEDEMDTRPASPKFKVPRVVPTRILSRLPRPRIIVGTAALVLAALWLIIWVVPGKLNPIISSSSPQAKRWYEMGMAALRDGAYFQASKSFEQAVKADSKFPLAHARLAEALMELDYMDKAKDELLRVSALVPDRSKLPNLEGLYLQAIIASVTREHAEVIEAYRRIAQEAPDAERQKVYVDLGRAYEANQEIKAAIESYEQAIREDPQYAAAFLRSAILYGRQRNSDMALEAFQKAESLYQLMGNFEGVTQTLYCRGTFFNSLDKLAEAREQLQKALERARTTANTPLQIGTLLQLSNVYYTQTDTTQAQQYAAEAISLAQAEGLENLATDGLIDLGTAYFVRGDYAEAERLFKQALEFAQKYKGRRGEARALLSLASLMVQKGDADSGLGYIEPALTFYRQGNYHRETMQAYMLLGRAYRQKGDFDSALTAFEQQMSLAEQAGDQSQVALSHSSIGTLLSYQEEYARALEHFEKSAAINESLGTQSSLGYDLMNQGRMLWQLGLFEQAREKLDRAASIADRPGGNKQLSAWIYLHRARMALTEMDCRRSKLGSEKVLELSGSQYKDIDVQAKHTLGLALAMTGSRPRGIQLCEEAASLAKSLTNPRLLSGALLALSEAQLESGDAQGALKSGLEEQGIAAGLKQKDSEWRAWLIAARSSRHLGQEEAAADYAAKARDVLLSLRAKWGDDNYTYYTARPDIRQAVKRLEELAGKER